MNQRHGIQSPADLKNLSLEDLEHLSQDLRQEILSACMKNGGHLGASLGAVEIAVALHRVFESPSEPIVWDVGHQAYAHKLLTGRWEKFQTLRTENGISGFLSREESPHDVFGAGHSSTSLSAALAMAWARKGNVGALAHKWTVAVIGDGGLTAGVAFEALMNTRALDHGPFLVILNDNQMSISPNVGAIPAILASGEAREFFSHFGFDYVGPLDGHDLNVLIGTLQGIRDGYSGRPIVLHVLTQKGKGYFPAEESPAAFHGMSPIQTKVPAPGTTPKKLTYSEAFGKAICEAAEQDPRIVAITAAMPEGTSLTEFSKRFPDRFFDVGISEPHAVTFAAGLATQGYKPVVAIYSTFLQRGLDAIIHDVALQKLGVVFAIDRAGIVGADGPTHHGCFDLAFLGMIPGMKLTSPSCLEDMKPLLNQALNSQGPVALRYPRGSGSENFSEALKDAVRFHQKAVAPQVVFVGLGFSASKVAQAAKAVDASASKVTAISVVEAKPIPSRLLEYLNANPKAAIITLEDGSVAGGFGHRLKSEIKSRPGSFEILGYGDHFISHGSPGYLEKQEKLDANSLETRLTQVLSSQST